jgi:hypothetical protein
MHARLIRLAVGIAARSIVRTASRHARKKLHRISRLVRRIRRRK